MTRLLKNPNSAKLRRRMEHALIGAVFVLTVLLPAFRTIIKAKAQSDTTPMQLVSLSLATSTIDVSLEDGYLEMSGEIYEDLSGFHSIEWYYTSPSGDQIIGGDANGDPQYINEVIRVPQYSETGLWRPTFTLIDEASNSITYTPDELISLGLNAEFTVTSSVADTSAPTLVDLTLNNSAVDVSSSTQIVSGTVHINDDLSGIDGNDNYMVFTSPSGNQRSTGTLSWISGNEYLLTLYVQQYAEAGIWTPSLTTSDVVGNTRMYESADLTLLGINASVNVTGISDTTPVDVNSMYFSAAFPPLGDIYANSAKITIYAEFSDNLAGIGTIDLLYRSQTSTQTASTNTVITESGAYQYTVYLPPFAAGGVWHPELITLDLAGNYKVYDYTELASLGFNMELSLEANEIDQVDSGGAVTTDIDNDGATPSDPFEATVTTPVAGEIAITQVSLTNPVSTNDYQVFDQQYDINAPAATVSEPLVFAFRIDASHLDGQTSQSIVVFRNGVLVPECSDPIMAIPDPCVASRETLSDDDVELSVRSSHASVWALGYSVNSGPQYTFKGFKKPIKPAPKLNKVDDGESISVKFDLGGDFGLNVLPAYIAKSQKISCSTKEPKGEATPIITTKNGDLSVNNNELYRFKWKTLDKWEDSCRQLLLEFSNGETVVAYFKFDD